MLAAACQTVSSGPAVVDPVLKSIGTVADPFVIDAPIGFGFTKEYLYTTTSLGKNVPTLKRNIYGGWDDPTDALPTLPGWAQADTVWAPEVIHLPSRPPTSSFVLYFAAKHVSHNVHCLGVGTAATAQGPFTALAQPLSCQTDCGSIDPNPFVAPGGTLYLAWKWDGQACGPNVINRIHAVQMSSDGLSTVGADSILLEADPSTWEGYNIEAPEMYLRNGVLHFFYAGGQHWNGSYAEGRAICAAPLGPCARTATGPLITSGGAFCGPGHGAPFTTPEGLSKFVFHAYESCSGGQPTAGAGRKLFEADLCWDGAQPATQANGEHGCLP